MLTTRERAEAVGEARGLVQAEWPEAPREASCLYLAVALQGVLFFRHGLRAMLQAGTAVWPRVLEDDGVSDSHFGYVWEPDSDVTRARLALGVLPELHCWLGLSPERSGVEEPTIVDPTTGSWPERAGWAGRPWEAPPPPDFLWATEADMARRWPGYLAPQYRAALSACEVAGDLATREIYPRVAAAMRRTK